MSLSATSEGYDERKSVRIKALKALATGQCNISSLLQPVRSAPSSTARNDAVATRKPVPALLPIPEAYRDELEELVRILRNRVNKWLAKGNSGPKTRALTLDVGVDLRVPGMSDEPGSPIWLDEEETRTQEDRVDEGIERQGSSNLSVALEDPRLGDVFFGSRSELLVIANIHRYYTIFKSSYLPLGSIICAA